MKGSSPHCNVLLNNIFFVAMHLIETFIATFFNHLLL